VGGALSVDVLAGGIADLYTSLALRITPERTPPTFQCLKYSEETRPLKESSRKFPTEDRGYLFPKYSAASMRLNSDYPTSEDIEEIGTRGPRVETNASCLA